MKEKKYYVHETSIVYDEHLLSDVRNNCSFVKQIFYNLKNGNIAAAKKILKDFLISFMDEGFLVNELNNSYAFRGIAPYVDLRSDGYDALYDKNLSTDITFFRMRTKDEGDAAQITELKI
ncbi:MAG: hypothetical protein IJ733_14080 [Lachnospiraceae bacterium]|nr:hypothetical protein [Lachnospiraceae bacterium]